MSYLRPKDWQRFQHYSDRRPTWIKFYVDLLDNHEYADLKPAAMLFLHHFWLFFARLSKGGAAEPPQVLNDPKWLATKVPGKLTAASVRSSLTELISTGFIEEFEARAKPGHHEPDRASKSASNRASAGASKPASNIASSVLANFDQNASADTELDTLQFSSSLQQQIQKEDTEEEGESDGRARESTAGTAEKHASEPNLGESNPPAFEAIRAAYPKGIYRAAEWGIAEKLIGQHVADGHGWEEILAGVKRYAAQKAATQSIGTQYVKNPVRFFERVPGRRPEFIEDFPLPTPVDPKAAAKERAEQLERDRLRRLMEGRAARGLAGFRDPYPHEKADGYETQLRLAEQDNRGRKASA